MMKDKSKRTVILWFAASLLWAAALLRDLLTNNASGLMTINLIGCVFCLSSAVAALIKYFRVKNGK